ncbi:hypothetical protein ACS0TY_026307 [Phlomoides rotata]
MRVKQWKDESDEDYLDRIDEIFLMGNPVGDDLQLHTALSGLKAKSRMFKHMTKDYPISYADFRRQAGDMITRQKIIASRLGEVEDDGKAKASSPKKKFSNHRSRRTSSSSRAPGTFQKISRLRFPCYAEIR